MRNLYTTLALAATVSVSAMAGNLAASRTALECTGLANFEENVKIERQSDMQKALQVSSVDDLVGAYNFYFNTGFDSDKHTGTVIIEKGASANDVKIYGLCQRSSDFQFGGMYVTGTLDPAKGTITIPEQVVDNEDPSAPIKLIPYDISSSARTAACTITICSEGVTSAGQPMYGDGCLAGLGGVCFWFADEASYAESYALAIDYNVILTPVTVYGSENEQLFEYNAADWKSLGNGSFTNKLIPTEGFYGSAYPSAYDVTVMQKADGTDEYLIVNPFGSTTPFKDVNDGTDGYIYINATNPNCVLVKPCVYSGFTDMQLWPMGQLYFANNEGYLYYMLDYSYDEVIEEVEWYGDTASSMTRNGNNVTINIESPLVANVCDIYTYGGYSLGSYSFSCAASTLTFVAEAGVDGILNDADAAAKRYFNLQGVEITNPEAGQVVIVKEGNKATKAIF